jgi:glycosyltransferase involved in cell wall biosynthesis
MADAPLRVLVVISNLEYGGAQRQVVELANHADPTRLDVHLCSLSEYVPLAAGLRDQSRLHVVHKRFKFDAGVVPRLARLLVSLKAQVVQSYLPDADVAARLAGRFARTPIVAGSERNTDYVLNWRQRAGYRVTRSMVDVIVANSRAGAEFNRRMLGHHASLYRIVRNGVDAARFTPGDGAEVRKELGLSPDTPVVGMFASFKEQKNHPLFFAAARVLLDARPGARFLLVGEKLYGGMHGSDEYRRRMDALVGELGLRDQSLFLGNRMDVERLYPACDVTVLPSLFEGTPNVLLESMACGVPVVATDVSDNAEIVPDGRVGYVVPLGDAPALAERILRLLGDAERRREMGRQARAWVEKEFTGARLVEKTEAVYREALAARAVSAARPRERASGPRT